ncbi:hypothetical protein DK1_000043 [Bacillus phage DK1]|uniref:Uncharacterized protein n=1 Tax=Bacillus phage DK1 TaxID=2500808 RepID=A0A3T0IIT9_9CAUD|nr:hypothetical protein H3016_gp43 [Bacillus phage DK1]AZU99747.1 hypothetical protein DK1_000043 [Bacillus phage DK1]
MTFKISDHLIEVIDVDTIVYTNKVKLSEEYKMRQRMKSQLMNSLYGKPKNYGFIKENNK